MTIHVTPIPSTIELGTPAFLLGLTNTAGSSVSAVAADSTLLAFDTTLPDTITIQSSGVGVATTASRRDHAHGLVAADIVAAATEAEMLAASSTTVYDTPGRTQYHPGVAKAWAKIATSGTSFNASYGFSGVSKPATGRRTVTLSTAMSSMNWCAVTDVNSSGGGVYTQVDITAASTVDIYIKNTSHAAADNSTMVACWGEQS